MRNLFAPSMLLVFLLVLSACSKDENNSTNNSNANNNTSTNQKLQLVVDGVTKTFQIQASKINGAIRVVGTATAASRVQTAETLSFTVYEDPLMTKVYSLSYTADGNTYFADDSLMSELSQHNNGKIKGTFSGLLTTTGGSPSYKNISQCSFDFTYDPGTSGSSDISDALHMSFSTPDWNRFINCDLLDLYPYAIDNTTNYVSASSQSTNETFVFSIPADSSAMVLSSNFRKYYIRDYASPNFQGAFEFSQKLPLSSGSISRLISQEELSPNSYNEVAAITYVGSETNYAVFKVKCRYKMVTAVVGDPSNTKTVTGTFHLKVRTSKN